MPQPPAKALAVPTTLGLNMQELQNWQHTKQASAKPMAQRVMMNVAELVTMDMENTADRQVQYQDRTSSSAITSEQDRVIRVCDRTTCRT